MAWSTVPAVVAGVPLPKATWLDVVTADVNILGSSWTSFTPTLGSDTGTAPSLGSGGTAVGYALRAGAKIEFRIIVTWGSGLSVGTANYTLTLPGVSPQTFVALNSVLFIRTAAAGNNYYGAAHIYSPGNVARLLYGTGANPFVTGTTPVAWANGDTITLAGSMEST